MPSRRAQASGKETPRGGRRPAPDPGGAVSGGLAERELTPQVRATLARLNAESELMRRELADARSRIALLERLADEDSLAPIANRRAFLRELSRMIAFSRRYDVPSSVVYFDVNGM